MSLFRSIATVGGWTMGSRILGFVRDILMAGTLGAGLIADAFFVAFKFPNFFRRLLNMLPLLFRQHRLLLLQTFHFRIPTLTIY